jgi:hypothetical protein
LMPYALSRCEPKLSGAVTNRKAPVDAARASVHVARASEAPAVVEPRTQVSNRMRTDNAAAGASRSKAHPIRVTVRFFATTRLSKAPTGR